MTPAAREIQTLEKEIHILEAGAIARATSAIEFKVEIGKRLVRAKEILPHGQFLGCAQKEFSWTPMHVNRHIHLARNITRVLSLGPEASLRGALAAIAAPEWNATPGEPAASAAVKALRVVFEDTGERRFPGKEEYYVCLGQPGAELSLCHDSHPTWCGTPADYAILRVVRDDFRQAAA
jgi:hypothetical protein